ncbi:MAG: Fic family protein [Verrucomicrobiota bacterium]
MPFAPQYQISGHTAKALMAIEGTRTALEGTIAATPRLISALRESARLTSTHFSTQIEGNRLTQQQVEEVILGKKGFPGRERDEAEVLNHYCATEYMETLVSATTPITEEEVQKLHGLVMDGSDKASPYRSGQNVIRDGHTSGIVYLPPEAPDVPVLMAELLEWVNTQIEEAAIPVPVIAGLAHYQFATIHPYYDGNGRTARLLTNLILHRCDYGLNGIYSLEEYYAQNLGGYYEALTVGDSHNYYMGRAECDVSRFVEYFCVGMAESFEKIAANRNRLAPSESDASNKALLRELSTLQRQALGLFHESRVITSRQLADYLSIDTRKARGLCAQWEQEEFLMIENPSKKARSYRLAEEYESSLM